MTGAENKGPLRYPKGALLLDYGRAALGLAIGLVGLLSLTGAPVIMLIFGGIAVLFLLFGLRTLGRQLLSVAWSEAGVTLDDWRRREIAWNDLASLRLRYFGTRREHKQGGGFLELTLTDGATKARLDSALDSFEGLLGRAVKAARQNGLDLDATTRENLEGLGLGEPAPAFAGRLAEQRGR